MDLNIKTNLQARFLGSPRISINGRPFIGGICLHDTSGSGTHNDTEYLANPGDGRKVSVDFTVERDGTVYKLNPDLEKHYTDHAGRATSWKAAGRRFLNHDVTRVLIGIELVQKADMSLSPIWPSVQLQAAAELCFSLCKQFQLTKDQITTHARIVTDGSRTDPRNFPFDSFWFYFNRAATLDGDDPAGNRVFYTVADGDSLWKIAKQFNTTIEGIKELNGINQASNLIVAGQHLLIRK